MHGRLLAESLTGTNVGGMVEGEASGAQPEANLLGPWPQAEFDIKLMDKPGYLRRKDGTAMSLKELLDIATMPPQDDLDKEGREQGEDEDGDDDDDGGALPEELAAERVRWVGLPRLIWHGLKRPLRAAYPQTWPQGAGC